MDADKNGSVGKPWRPATPEVTAHSFRDTAIDDEPIAVHYWAAWDAYDKDVDQTIQAIAPRLKGWVRFYSTDVDLEENCEWCKSLGLASIPCVIIFVDGQPTHRIIGNRDEKTFVREILRGLSDEASKTRPWWKLW